MIGSSGSERGFTDVPPIDLGADAFRNAPSTRGIMSFRGLGPLFAVQLHYLTAVLKKQGRVRGAVVHEMSGFYQRQVR